MVWELRRKQTFTESLNLSQAFYLIKLCFQLSILLVRKEDSETWAINSWCYNNLVASVTDLGLEPRPPWGARAQPFLLNSTVAIRDTEALPPNSTSVFWYAVSYSACRSVLRRTHGVLPTVSTPLCGAEHLGVGCARGSGKDRDGHKH